MVMDYAAYWNGSAGVYWTQRQQEFDGVLAPIGHAAMESAHLAPGDAVIDLGCGTGTTSIEIASRIGAEGKVLGVDISKPMLDLAKARAFEVQNIEFAEADAATHAFETAAFDVLYSRVGCMFFPDPVKAFSNLRKGLRDSARLSLACFREPNLTTYVSVPVQAAYAHLPPRPKPGPDDPHMFSFADSGRVRRILGSSGFADIDLKPVDLEIDLANGGGLERAVSTAMIGGIGALLVDQTDEVREKVIDAIHTALQPYVRGNKVPMSAAIWVVTARAA